MLNTLLELLREGGVRRIRSLADELDTTPELVEAMLEHLTRTGYLRRLGSKCVDQCSTCHLSQACVAGTSACGEGTGQGPAVWALAEERRAT